MSTLHHLRELDATNNQIVNISGVLHSGCLIRIKAGRNEIRTLHFEDTNLPRLEELDLSDNIIEEITGLETHPRLCVLNLSNFMQILADRIDTNRLRRFILKKMVSRMRVLKLANNQLKTFDGRYVPHLRSLVLDNNKISKFSNLHELKSLESFSSCAQRVDNL